MEYQLEIHCSDAGTLKIFNSTSPFMPFCVGDLLDATMCGEPVARSKYRVVNVEHQISTKPNLGIDPSGRNLHRLVIHIDRIPNTAQSVQEA